MISTLNNRISAVATARRMIAIPLLVIALAFATMAAIPQGNAFADGGKTVNTEQAGTTDIDSISTAHCLLPGIPC